MKNTFTKSYILANRGCYSKKQVEALIFINNEIITINDFILSEQLSLRDKFWWVSRKCELTKEQNVQNAIDCAEIILSLFEAKYSEDKRPREAIEAAKKWINLPTRENAAAADAAAYAADYAAYADYAAADAAAYAAYAAAAYAADAAAAAADAAVAAVAYAYASAASAAAAAAAAVAAADARRSEILKQCADIVRRHYPVAPNLGAI